MAKIKIHNVCIFTTDTVMWILTVALYTSFFVLNMSSASSFGVMAIAMLMFAVFCATNKRITLTLEKFYIFFALFSLFSLCSALWARIPADALEKSVTMFSISICLSIVYLCYRNMSNTSLLLKAVMWGGYASAIYVIYKYGFREIMILTQQGTRLGIDFVGTNAMGMLSAVSITLTLYFIFFERWRWIYVIAIIPVYVLAVTESRTAIVECLVGVIALVIAREMMTGRNKDIIYKIFKVFKVMMALVVAGITLYYIMQLPVFSGVYGRMQDLINALTGKAIEGSTQQRTGAIKAGLEQFLKTPFIGIGMGNPHLLALKAVGHNYYLHNNYVELLAGGGIVGFSLYYGMYLYLGISMLKLKKYWDSNTIMCMILMLMNLVVDVGIVSYYDKATCFILLVCFLEVKFLKGRGSNNA